MGEVPFDADQTFIEVADSGKIGVRTPKAPGRMARAGEIYALTYESCRADPSGK